MKGYKGFAPGLVCRGKQYAENTVFEEKTAHICHSGMHFCENPLDVLDHYPILGNDAKPNDFAEVEALDEVKTDDDRKYCTTKLKVGAKLTIPGFTKACVDFMLEKTAVSSDEVARMINDTAASGDSSKLAASGDSSKLAASGDYSKLAASGDSSKLAASGYSSQLAASGKHSVVAGIGIDNKAKAIKGCWITLSEWKWDDEEDAYIPVCVKSERVDGVRIKENVFYTLRNGEFVEVNG